MIQDKKLSYEYIRGLTEGEGTFTFSTSHKLRRKVPAFALRMHVRDKGLLEIVRDSMGLKNKIYEYDYKRNDGYKRGPQAILIVREFGQLKNIIVPFFYKRLKGNKGKQFNDWLETNQYLLKNKLIDKVSSQLDSLTKISGKVAIGKNCSIKNCVINGPTAIGNDVKLENCQIGPNTSIYHHCQLFDCKIENSVLMDNITIKNLKKPIKTSFLGPHCEIVGTDGKSLKLFIGEMAKIASLSFRLFGNVFAGEILLVSMSAIFAYAVPLPFLFLELLVGLVQAVVFSMLTLVYFTISAMEHGHEEREEAEHIQHIQTEAKRV